MTTSIRKRENKKGTSYQVTIESGYRADGKRIRSYVTCKTLKEARAVAAEKMHEYNINNYIEPSKITVKELCEQWFKVYCEPNLADTTKRGYKVNLEKHVYPYIGHIHAQKLTPVNIQEMYRQLSKEGHSPRTIQYVHSTLHSALQYGYKLQIIGKNVCDFATVPKQVKYKPTILSEEEAVDLLQKVKDTNLEIPVNLALALGLRRGEVCGLQWSDINFADKTVNICHNMICLDGKASIGKTKTESSERTILMPDFLIEMLRTHKVEQAKIRLQLGSEYHNNDLVVCKPNGDPVFTSTLSQSFHRFLEKNDIRSIRFHDLRHLNATIMLAHGVPMKIASARLGHSNIQTTMDIYTHVDVKMQVDAAEELNNALLASGD